MAFLYGTQPEIRTQSSRFWKSVMHTSHPLGIMEAMLGFEPKTFSFVGNCSIQLSYTALFMAVPTGLEPVVFPLEEERVNPITPRDGKFNYCLRHLECLNNTFILILMFKIFYSSK